MAAIMPAPAPSAHPVLPDIAKPRMAKAEVRRPDIAPEVAWNERIGRAVERAVACVGWSHKEAAAQVGVDDAEFGKWLSGARRPQFDRLFAVSELRQPLVIALAALADVDVKTTIEFRRSA